MHRSYSSLVAGAMSELMPIGDMLLQADIGNPLGYNEDKQCLQLNKDILHVAGGSWDDPPSHEDVEAVAHKFIERAKAIVDSKSGLWCFKDPRTCLTWAVWSKVLTNPVLICLQRSEDEVVNSLLKRNNMDQIQAKYLYDIYNERINQIWNNERD